MGGRVGDLASARKCTAHIAFIDCNWMIWINCDTCQNLVDLRLRVKNAVRRNTSIQPIPLGNRRSSVDQRRNGCHNDDDNDI